MFPVNMKFSLREIEVFCAVVAYGGVRKAADEIGMTQSAASQSLSKLESGIGKKLFCRYRQRLIINEYGRTLLPHAHSILDKANNIQSIFNKSSLSLRFAASTTIANYILPNILYKYKKQNPGNSLIMNVGNTKFVIDSVMNMESEFGFIEGPCFQPELQIKRWKSDEMILVTKPDHWAANEYLQHNSLAKLKWIFREKGSGTRDEVERWLRAHIQDINIDTVLGDSESIKRAVALGMGASCLPSVIAVDMISAGLLAQIKSDLPRLVRPLSIIWHGSRNPKERLDALLGASQE